MKTIFDNTEIKNLKLKNLLFRSATWEALADDNGHFDEEIYNIYDQLAAGGVGCIISGFTYVSDSDRYFGGMARLSNDGLIPELHITMKINSSDFMYGGLDDSCPLRAE